jgi:hypothetical protein
METQKNRIIQAILWFLPTWLEVVLYIFLSAATIVASNLVSLKAFLYVGNDFNPISSAIDSINQLLTHFVGERVAGSLSLAIFWGLVGVGINIIWIVIANFSTELNNDLVFSSYVHPSMADPKEPLREFTRKFLFRFGVTLVFLFYINFVIRAILPSIANKYVYLLKHWADHPQYGSLILALLSEIIVLHGFVVLTRLLLLRKQVFSR